jgi:reactive intermediate/imine deaminase
MNRKQILNPDTVTRPVGDYAQAVRAGDFLFISGQIALDRAGNFVGEGDARAQTRQVFENIRAILHTAGGTLDDIVKMTAFLTDMKDRMACAEARREVIPSDFPAMTLCEVSQLVIPQAKIEVEAIALLPQDASARAQETSATRPSPAPPTPRSPVPAAAVGHVSTQGIRLDGKCALVVGASRGIGRAIALALAGAGADVAVAARSVAAIETVAGAIRDLGRRSFALELDVTQFPAISPAVDQAHRALGRIDVLVNAAGRTIPQPALELTHEDWDRILDVNLKGAFFISQVVARHMKQQGAGRIINIASSTSHGAISGLAPYGASKAGISGLTRHLAVEWAPYGITVNAVAPGWTRTAFTERRFSDTAWFNATVKRIPLGRVAEPEDLGGVAVFLASDDSAYLTGQTIYVEGGLTIDLTTRM